MDSMTFLKGQTLMSPTGEQFSQEYDGGPDLGDEFWSENHEETKNFTDNEKG